MKQTHNWAHWEISVPYCDAFRKHIFCRTGYWRSIKYRKEMELGLVIEDVVVVRLGRYDGITVYRGI